MRIAVGSLNPVKKQAAADVLAPLFPGAEWLAVDVPSGVSVQPWSDEETRTGAINRAHAALTQTHADLAVGLEGGLTRTTSGLMTCAWCAVLAADGRLGIGGGAHTLLPPAAADRLARGEELGTVMDWLSGQHNSKHGDGAIGILTDGLESRRSAYAHILRLALAPFRRPELFDGPGTASQGTA
ncbi:MAG: DUF84 family protein [Anaerolineae bacterium]|nr:DUF84 family protein [Anaerolineae bacterium]